MDDEGGDNFAPAADEEKLKNLLELGLDEEKCRLALMITDNNVEAAATMAMEYDTDRLYQLYDEARHNFGGEDAEGDAENPDAADFMNMFSQSLQCKMVILVRSDLGMSVGKVAAQVGHAVLGCYKVANMEVPENVAQWEMLSWPKIVLQVESEQQMDEMR